MKIVVLSVAVWVSLHLVSNAGADPVKTDSYRTKVLMHSFEREMTKLQPYLTSEEKFKSPQARKAVAASLSVLQSEMQQERPDQIEENPGFRLNFSLMSYHIQKTKKAFDLGAFEFARQNLVATGGFCMACHTQAPPPKKDTLDLWARNSVQSVTMENAEYMFITRHFDLALEMYDGLVRGFPKNGLSVDRLPELYRRKLALLARVKRLPSLAIENLKRDLENKDIPSEIRQNVSNALLYFEKWRTESSDLTSPSPERMSTADVLTYVKKNLSGNISGEMSPADPDVVKYLRLSGLLYERLTKELGDPGNQEILYYLALCERKLARSFWYSLHQAYLRECIMKYPKSEVTKKCFDAYERDLEGQMSGTSQMTSEMRSTLETLRKYLK